jgi:hypothetical protein
MYCIRLRKLTNRSDKNSPAIFESKLAFRIFNCHFTMRVPLRQVEVRKKDMLHFIKILIKIH